MVPSQPKAYFKRMLPHLFSKIHIHILTGLLIKRTLVTYNKVFELNTQITAQFRSHLLSKHFEIVAHKQAWIEIQV